MRIRLLAGIAAVCVGVFASFSASQPSCDVNGQLFPLEPDPGRAPSPALDCNAISFVEYVNGAYRWVTKAPGGGSPVPFAPSALAIPAQSPYLTSCWSTLANTISNLGGDIYYTPARLPDGIARGGRLGINLLTAPQPGDFPPPSPTIGGSSVALLPPGAGQAATWWMGASRPSVDGLIDLVTGVPLIQTTDLELPMGSAKFRLTRTRSSARVEALGGIGEPLLAGDRWWDWTGLGWMSSENPLLLIDSAVPDIVGAGPRTTWLWLDAHHSIPFQRVYNPSSGTVTYEAPPRFRARMKHNGVWAIPDQSSTPSPYVTPELTTEGTWRIPPTQFDVWLYDGLLHYTFVAMYDNVDVPGSSPLRQVAVGDVPPNRWDQSVLNPSLGADAWAVSNYHDRPFLREHFASAGDDRATTHSPFNPAKNRGFGIPHMGLCVKMEDQFGHTVEIDYCASKRLFADDPGTACVECVQDCATKGQIRSVRLKSGTETLWTLVYTHRKIADANANGYGSGSYLYSQFPAQNHPDLYSQHSYVAVDRIYVFAGAVSEAALACMTLTSLDTGGFAGGIEPLVEHNGSIPPPPVAIPLNWRYQIRYHYDPEIDANNTPTGRTSGPPILLKTTVRTRAAGATTSPLEPAAAESVSTKIFVYKEPRFGSGGGGNDNRRRVVFENRGPWLRMVFTDTDIKRLFANVAGPATPWLTPDSLALWATSTHDFEDLNGGVEAMLTPFASFNLENAPYYQTASAPNAQSPSTGSLLANDYLVPDAGAFPWGDAGHHMVRRAEIGTGAGRRLFRIHRFMMPPAQGSQSSEAPFLLGPSAYREPTRGFNLQPFAWQSTLIHFSGVTTPGDSDRLTYAQGPDMSKARWIVMVDEFPLNHLTGTGAVSDYPEGYISYDSETGVKPGQLSRRVVEMNAAGYILRERRWEYDAEGAIANSSGGGLGEQFIYRTVRQIFNLPSGVTNGELVPQATADTIVPVEHRSVGWSAAKLLGVEAEKGLVNFGTYTLVRESETENVWKVDLAAEGVQRGTGPTAPSTRLYSEKNLSLPNRATHPTHDVVTEISVKFQSPMNQAQYDAFVAPAGPEVTLEALQAWADAGHNVAVVISKMAAEPADVPIAERRSEWQLTIQAPRRLRPGASAWFFPIDMQWFRDDGNLEWSATGLVKNPFAPASAEAGDALNSLVLSYHHVLTAGEPGAASGHGVGQVRHVVVDALAGATAFAGNGETVGVPAWPATNWSRLPQDEPSGDRALQFVTTYVYDYYGMSDTFLPNGQRWARRSMKIPKGNLVIPPDNTPTLEQLEAAPDEVERIVEFSDLTPVFSNGTFAGTYRALSPGKVTDFLTASAEESSGWNDAGGNIFMKTGAFRELKVEFPDPIDLANIPITSTWFTPLARVKFGVDSQGFARKASLLEWVPNFGLRELGTKEVNDLGEVYRELSLDGTIVRITKNHLGHKLRRYIGMRDTGWACACNNATENPPLEYDMVLVDRTEYGTGVNDAWLPTVSRKYRSSPEWAKDHYEAAPLPDPDGIPTVTSYDWRMRPVIVRSFPQGDHASGSAVPESTTVNYLDHAGRSMLTVSFGRGVLVLPSEKNPTADDFFQVPVPESLYGLNLRPLSMTQVTYQPDGSEAERRTYRMDWDGVGSAPYTASFSFQGAGGQTIFSQSPGQPVEITELDGQGRAKVVRTVAPGVGGGDGYQHELARTHNTYDRFNNLIEVKRWERVKENPGDPENNVLSALNAVRTRTLSWYDEAKRLVARVELGSEQSQYVYGPLSSFVRYTMGSTATQDEHAPAPTLDTTTGVVTVPSGIPAHAPVWVYVYDKSGNQIFAAAPSDRSAGPASRVTKSEYSGTGRLIRKTEDVFGLARKTEYEYTVGRLTALRAFSSATAFQQSTVAYGADLVDTEFSKVVSGYGAYAGTTRMPNPATGQEGETSDIRLRYTVLGQVAERIDARGLSLRYRYDDFGRTASIEVGHYASLAASTEPANFVPGLPASLSGVPDQVGYIEQTYASSGRLDVVRAYTLRDPASRSLVANNRYVFDADGNLLLELQPHGLNLALDVNGDNNIDPDDLGDFINCFFATPPCPQADFNGSGDVDPDDLGDFVNAMFEAPAGALPSVTYAWHKQDTDPVIPTVTGHSRIAGMSYPAHSGADARALTFNYNRGESDSSDPAVAAAESALNAAVNDALSRVTGIDSTLAAAPAANIAAFAYSGESRRTGLWLGFGSGPAAVTQRLRLGSEVGYAGLDAYGRLLDLHYQNSASADRTLYRAEYTYDNAGNRITSRMTQAGSSGVATSTSASTNVRSQLNGYDGLDRLVAANAGTLSFPSGQPSMPSPWRAESWRLDLVGNWIGQNNQGYFHHGRETLVNGADFAKVTHSVNARNQITNIEASGSGLVTNLTPTYDAAGFLTSDGNYGYQYDGFGRLVQVTRVSDGAWIKRHVYDGFGRLIKTRSPFPDPTTAASGAIRTEAMFYDGARRIQEIVTDPEQSAALTREYIWGPGDGPAGIDELLAQFDGAEQHKPWWALQDADGNLMAICESPQPGGSGTTPGPARVAGQWTYDAYGVVLTGEEFFAHPTPHCGHKGLFVDRLDAGVLTGGTETSRLWTDWPYQPTFAKLVVHVRNRSYLPDQGRFMQMDPNQTAAALLSLASQGGSLSGNASGFDFGGRFGDGANFYQYVRSNPVTGFDPSGLEGLIGQLFRAAIQNQMLRQGFTGGLSQGIMDGGMSLWNGESMGEAAADAGVGFAIGFVTGMLGGALTAQPGCMWTQGLKAMLRESIWSRKAAAAMVTHAGTGALGGALQGYYEGGTWQSAAEGAAWGGLTGAAGGIAGRFLGTMFCFVEGTPVATPDGFTAINKLRVGDRVLSDNPCAEGTEVDPATWRKITLSIPCRVFKGQWIEIETLKPLTWIEEVKAAQGTWIPYDLPEMGIEGPAKVLSIEPCPEIKPGMGRLVLSTYHRFANNVMEMHVTGENGSGEVVEVTANHPVFSADRGEWVEVGELMQGERVKTLGKYGEPGSIPVVTKPSPRPVREVWNLEVEGEHTYAASQSQLSVHNLCKAVSAIRDSRLIRAANNAGTNQKIQRSLDHLVGELQRGNLDAGGRKWITSTVQEVRHLDSGARVYFRTIGTNLVEIVAKSSKENQKSVISVLNELYP